MLKIELKKNWQGRLVTIRYFAQELENQFERKKGLSFSNKKRSIYLIDSKIGITYFQGHEETGS